jgi:hypothetical protein
MPRVRAPRVGHGEPHLLGSFFSGSTDREAPRPIRRGWSGQQPRRRFPRLARRLAR